ncbi:hypothetical protein, conserved, partial [Eimeria tenella]
WPADEGPPQQQQQQQQQQKQYGLISPPKPSAPDRRLRFWTRTEEALLLEGVKRFGKGSWREIQQ